MPARLARSTASVVFPMPPEPKSVIRRTEVLRNRASVAASSLLAVDERGQRRGKRRFACGEDRGDGIGRDRQSSALVESRGEQGGEIGLEQFL